MEEKFKNITGGLTKGRFYNLLNDMQKRNLDIDAYDIVETSDELTGVRYGNAKCRKGWAVKLGSGGRNGIYWKHAYQVWAVVKPEYRSKA